MPYLYLVRHAQPDFAGHYDSVTDLGLQQSHWLGEHFAERGLEFARVLTGDLRRHVETAAALLSRLAGAPAPIVDPCFNEYDAHTLLAVFGAAEDRQLRATGDRRRYFTLVREALALWARHSGPVPGGETWTQFGERIQRGLDRACADLAPEARVLVVTSGGVIGRIVADTLGAGADAAIQLNLQTRNTGVTEIACGRSASRVVAFNAVPHLERDGRVGAITHA